MPDRYKVSESGAITDQYGAVLYEAGCIKDLSQRAKCRLAELHTQRSDLDWEGAEQILVSEGLLDSETLTLTLKLHFTEPPNDKKAIVHSIANAIRQQANEFGISSADDDGFLDGFEVKLGEIVEFWSLELLNGTWLHI